MPDECHSGLPAAALSVYPGMKDSARRWIPYRKTLTARAQSLRGDKFTRQKPLGRYVADFYCSPCRLVIELDGDSHYTEGAQSYDKRRTDALERQGIRIIRFTNSEVLQNFGSVCAVIVAALQQSTEIVKTTPRSPSAHDPLVRGSKVGSARFKARHP